MEAITVGKRFRFAHPDVFVTLPEYAKHRGQAVTVVRELTLVEVDPENAPMYRVRADDGWEGDAWLDELETLE